LLLLLLPIRLEGLLHLRDSRRRLAQEDIPTDPTPSRSNTPTMVVMHRDIRGSTTTAFA
jgi:hypothetical protein